MEGNTLSERFRVLQDEYAAFYTIRNQPAVNVEYEDWRQLRTVQRKVWAGRLKEQAEKVFPLIAEMEEELRDYRPYHELQSFFREDVGVLEKKLGQYGFAPQRP